MKATNTTDASRKLQASVARLSVEMMKLAAMIERLQQKYQRQAPAEVME